MPTARSACAVMVVFRVALLFEAFGSLTALEILAWLVNVPAAVACALILIVLEDPEARLGRLQVIVVPGVQFQPVPEALMPTTPMLLTSTLSVSSKLVAVLGPLLTMVIE